MKLLLFLLAFPVLAEDLPFYIREIAGPRDAQAIIENDRSLSRSIDNADLTSGGTVNGNLTTAGDLAVTGDITISGAGNGITFPDGTTRLSASTPTRQVFKSSGTYTYTRPTDVREICIRMVAGGGGGGEGNTNNGSNGQASYFHTVVASSGMAGSAGADGAGGAGGTGGSDGGVSGVLRIPGQAGGKAMGGVTSHGGDSAFFGGGGANVPASTTGNSGATNSGGGGGGGAGAADFGGGGGGGESVEFCLSGSLAATYPLKVADGGNPGTGGATPDGGRGAFGVVIVDEHY